MHGGGGGRGGGGGGGAGSAVGFGFDRSSVESSPTANTFSCSLLCSHKR